MCGKWKVSQSRVLIWRCMNIREFRRISCFTCVVGYLEKFSCTGQLSRTIMYWYTVSLETLLQLRKFFVYINICCYKYMLIAPDSLRTEFQSYIVKIIFSLIVNCAQQKETQNNTGTARGFFKLQIYMNWLIHLHLNCVMETPEMQGV